MYIIILFAPLQSLALEEGGRKTRNSNGVRITPRPRLRNGKVFSKSDSDEDEDEEGECGTQASQL